MPCQFLRIEKCVIAAVCLCVLLSSVTCLRKYNSDEDIKLHYRRVISDDHDRRFSEDAKNLILDLHNFYRSNVTPPAADMKLMVWDEDLEHLAQIWADQCQFENGRPRSTYLKGVYGQSLYIGTDRTGYRATKMWLEAGDQYDVRTRNCGAERGCGHYVQVVWAKSSRIGCGVKKCGARYLMVCNYFESVTAGQPAYTVGVPCSQCKDENEILCWNNLCISQDQCERNRTFCEKEASCNLECHNCGRLNSLCQCECPDGWDSRDCSYPCEDQHIRCGRNPGFANKSACSLNGYKIRDLHCRKMCGKCNAVSEESWDTCCEGKLCEKGYVLNTSTCMCKKLCPGPLCDEQRREEDIFVEVADIVRQNQLLLIEKEEFLKEKEKLLEEKENFLKQKELYLREREELMNA